MRIISSASAPRGTPAGRSVRCLPLVSLVLLASWALPAVVASPAAADRGTEIASIDHITRQGLRREVFALDAPTEVRIRAEGLADREGKSFLSYGWILDLASRNPAWVMGADKGAWDHRSENWQVDDQVTLPAGIYALYFASYGGSFPLNKELRVFGLTLGRFEASVGPVVKWNEHGDDSRWGIRVEALSPGYRPARPPSEAPGPDPGAMIRFFELPNDAQEQERIDLSRPVDFRVHFTGEYDRHVRAFADGAWITDLSTYKKVWSPTLESTKPAGGDAKNRMFQGTVSLPAGSYALTVTTDGSHAFDSWNMPPPLDPEAWGISLSPVSESGRAFVRVTGAAGLPEPLIAIREVGNNEFRREPFVVVRPVRLFVRALGERSAEGEMADFAWIERENDLRPVWEMRDEDSEPAGGSAKNRIVESVIELPPGSYSLCYATDDSHSYPDWNSEPPRDPHAWGVSIAPIGPAEPDNLRLAGHPDESTVLEVPPPPKPPRPGRPPRAPEPPPVPLTPSAIAALVRPGDPPDPPTVIALTRVSSDADVSRRFRVTATTRFHLVALGEGSDEPLSDHGWIEDARSGKMIWEMRYRDTQHAGGARKNRIERAEITLPPGEYVLRYETDDSHAFGDWNSALPSQPELWGISLVEEK